MALSASQMAEKVNATPRNFRKFLRACPKIKNAGAGGRYSFREEHADAIAALYGEWAKGRAGNGDSFTPEPEQKKPATQKK